MERSYYLDLAASNKRMVFGVDLILQEKHNHDEILLNGEMLGKAVEETTKRFNMEVALPYMDLDIEKMDLLGTLGISPSELDTFHFTDQNLTEEVIEKVNNIDKITPTQRLTATCDAITYIKNNTNYLPVGMCIGPFSFITKLLSDPISPVFLASAGITSEDDHSVKTLELTMELATKVILRSVKMQIDAGAKAICVCEPAANSAYISPDTLFEDDEDVFDRLVLSYNFKIKELFDKHDVDLILHDCGELTPVMVKKLCKLDPVILSLGSSQKLWEEANIVPKDIVLFGNLPTKQFFMDSVTDETVLELTNDLDKKMCATGHPYIMGSECDVLLVDGYEEVIKKKVELMLGNSGGCS
ncbi:MAG: uroporphyrinogen decarboxylase family protein [Bacteroidota bacterium]